MLRLVSSALWVGIMDHKRDHGVEIRSSGDLGYEENGEDFQIKKCFKRRCTMASGKGIFGNRFEESKQFPRTCSSNREARTPGSHKKTIDVSQLDRTSGARIDVVKDKY